MNRFTLVVALLSLACGGEPAAETPEEPAESGPVLLASQKAAKSVAWYSLEGELLAEVAVSDHPHEIVRRGERLYVTDNGVMQIENAGRGGNKVSIIDLEARERIAEIDLGEFYRPHGIDVCADGRMLVTTENPDQLLIADLADNSITAEYETGGETPHIVRCSLDSEYAYVSNARSGNVAKIRLSDGERELVETGDRPEGQALSRDGTKLYVAHRDADKIVVVNTADWTVAAEIPTGGSPVRCGLSGDETLIAYGLFGDEAMGVASLAEGKELGQVPMAGPAVSLEMHGDDTALSCAQDAGVCYAVSVSERKLLHEVKVREGAGPDPALLLD